MATNGTRAIADDAPANFLSAATILSYTEDEPEDNSPLKGSDTR